MFNRRGIRNHRRKCASGDRCWDRRCSFSHPAGWLPCTVDCQVVTCTRVHPPGRILPKKPVNDKPCKNGSTCWKADCHFKHPSNWSPCPIGEYCPVYDCRSTHPPSRFLCRYAEGCMSFDCRAVHPLTRAQLCDDGQSCTVFHCWGIHPHERIRPCRNAVDCVNKLCPFLHPTDRIILPDVPMEPIYYPPPVPIVDYETHVATTGKNYRNNDNNWRKPTETLNPTAKAFIPPSNHLNPTAKEFVPPTAKVVVVKKKTAVICNICYDELNDESDKVQCNNAKSCHIFCGDCFIDQVQYQIIDENVGRFIQSNRRIVCSLCLPTILEFDDTIIAIRVGSTMFAQYRKAIETALEVEVCRRELEKNQKALIEMRAKKEGEACHRHRLHIAENILTLCCPRCKVPFIDFEGCFAVSCHACTCQFCAWCLKDCGSDAHQHVKACPSSLAPGGFYGQLSQFNTVHVAQRKNAVLAYLTKLSPEERITTQAVIANDLKDLGIVI